MSTQNDGTRLLATALEQTGRLLAGVDEAQLDRRTPCREWTVAQLVDHVVATPATLSALMRGEQPDFTGPPEHISDDREQRFRSSAAELLAAAHAQLDAEAGAADWQLAELAVHAWDLATATDQATDDLDAEVAERGLAFMTGSLTDENRGAMFDPEQPAPADAGPYERIAAFAGRSV